MVATGVEPHTLNTLAIGTAEEWQAPMHPAMLQTMRRWFQFRLRTLFAATLVVCVGLAWLMNERRRIAERNNAIFATGVEFNEVTQPEWSSWLFGDDAVGHARGMRLGAGKWLSDNSLLHLRGLSQLQDLDLSDAQVTIDGLVRLEVMSELTTLTLRGMKVMNPKSPGVTDGGLVHLK